MFIQIAAFHHAAVLGSWNDGKQCTAVFPVMGHKPLCLVCQP